MAQPDPAVAACRRAVRVVLTAQANPNLVVLVACSGGRDSLALAAAVAFEASRAARGVPGARGFHAQAVVVDHGLQEASAHFSAAAAQACTHMGLPAQVVRVAVERSGEGPEAAARTARYAALEQQAEQLGAHLVLLGHTRDDQAEQVLLGLVRGSGTRSLAGMPAVRGRFARPFLHLTRAETERACRAQGLTWWDDPHNEDPTYTRVRARQLMHELESRLGPGVVAGLARSAQLARADADALDHYAQQASAQLGELPWPVSSLVQWPAAVRGRVWLQLARRLSGAGGQVSSTHVAALEALVVAWRGQAATTLPGGVRVGRSQGNIVVVRSEDPLTG